MEINRIEAWLKSRLAGDATLMALVTGVFAFPAPEKAAFPYVVYQYQPDSSSDVLGVGATRIMVNAGYLVRVIGKDCGIEDLKTAADRMDALLHNYQLSDPLPAGGGVMNCYREQPFALREVDEGIVYPHLGGFYRICAN
jgi:hypothetical protein